MSQFFLRTCFVNLFPFLLQKRNWVHAPKGKEGAGNLWNSEIYYDRGNGRTESSAPTGAADDQRLHRCIATAPRPSSVCFADTFPGGEGNPLRRGRADRAVRPYGCKGGEKIAPQGRARENLKKIIRIAILRIYAKLRISKILFEWKKLKEV